MFELNKIIGIDDSRNNILVTLTDGRCALIDVNRRGFVVEILLDSFYKWMSFSDDFTEEDASNVKAILEAPEGIGYGPLAEEYVINSKIKRDFDEMKKELKKVGFDILYGYSETQDNDFGEYIIIAINNDVAYELNEPYIREQLQEKLPKYMVPYLYNLVDNLPLSRNGKVDRKKLLDINQKKLLNKKKEIIRPTNDIETQIYNVWSQILNDSAISIEDDFFVAGGDSILAIKCVSMLKSDYNIEINISDIFEADSLRDLAKRAKIIDKNDFSEIEEGEI